MQLSGDTDTTNFDHFEEAEPFYPPEGAARSKKKSRKDANFIGYTFKRDEGEQHATVIQALEELENIRTAKPPALHSRLRTPL